VTNCTDTAIKAPNVASRFRSCGAMQHLHIVASIRQQGPTRWVAGKLELEIVYAVMYGMLWPPAYSAERPYGKPMVPAVFHESILAPGGQAGTWLVLFQIAERYESISVAPLFAELATTYGGGALRFAEVDVGVWPEVAEQYKARSLSCYLQTPHLLCCRTLMYELPCARAASDRLACAGWLSDFRLRCCFGIRRLAVLNYAHATRQHLKQRSCLLKEIAALMPAKSVPGLKFPCRCSPYFRAGFCGKKWCMGSGFVAACDVCVQISVDMWSSQVPTLILFEGGKEVKRIPRSAAAPRVQVSRVRVLHLLRANQAYCTPCASDRVYDVPFAEEHHLILRPGAPQQVRQSQVAIASLAAVASNKESKMFEWLQRINLSNSGCEMCGTLKRICARVVVTCSLQGHIMCIAKRCGR
jgi:hypothetical protein